MPHHFRVLKVDHNVTCEGLATLPFAINSRPLAACQLLRDLGVIYGARNHRLDLTGRKARSDCQF